MVPHPPYHMNLYIFFILQKLPVCIQTSFQWDLHGQASLRTIRSEKSITTTESNVSRWVKKGFKVFEVLSFVHLFSLYPPMNINFYREQNDGVDCEISK